MFYAGPTRAYPGRNPVSLPTHACTGLVTIGIPSTMFSRGRRGEGVWLIALSGDDESRAYENVYTPHATPLSTGKPVLLIDVCTDLVVTRTPSGVPSREWAKSGTYRFVETTQAFPAASQACEIFTLTPSV